MRSQPPLPHPGAPPSPSTDERRVRHATAALLFGNLVVACGVMSMPGMLHDLALDLHVSVPVAGQLLSVAALVLCVGAPLAAALTWRTERRRLLLITLLAFALGHAACALAPDYATLALLRPLAVVGAAVFAPQAAATIGLMVPIERRATAVTTVFLGWSIASVMAMPLGSLIAGYLNWRATFVLIALLSVVAALAVARVIPRGLQVPPLSLQSWLLVARSARLRRVLAATLTWCAGQFIVLGYVTPSLHHFIDASPARMALLMSLQGLAGLAGSVVLARAVARIGPDRGARTSLTLITLGLVAWCACTLVWPTTAAFAATFVLWGLGSFAFVSSQQARLAVSAPALASASIALNSSSLYAGQALGAALGGLLVAHSGYGALGPVALLIMLGALALSVLADRGPAQAAA